MVNPGRPVTIETRENITILMQYLTHNHSARDKSTFGTIAINTGIAPHTVRRLLAGASDYAILFERKPDGGWGLTGYMPEWPVDLSTAPEYHDRAARFTKVPEQNQIKTPLTPQTQQQIYHVAHIVNTIHTVVPFNERFTALIERVVAEGKQPSRIPQDSDYWHIVNVWHCLEVIATMLKVNDPEAYAKKKLDKPDDFPTLPVIMHARKLKENKA